MNHAVHLFFILIIAMGALHCDRYDRSNLPVDEIQSLAGQFDGDVGIYLADLKTGETFEMNADTLFTTASTINIGIFDKIEKGELAYDQMLMYDGEHDDTRGKDLINQLESGSEVQLSKLVYLMMSTSNNTASRWNQHLAGTGTEINRLMESLGMNGQLHVSCVMPIRSYELKNKTPTTYQAEGVSYQ